MKLRLQHHAVGEVAFPLSEGGQAVLGRRGGETGIELNWDPKISRRHARVWIEGDALWIEDLGSRNGTWFEGQRLSAPFRIEPGVCVRVGETGLTRGGETVDLAAAETSKDLPSESAREMPRAEPKPAPTAELLADGTVGVEVPDEDTLHELLKTGVFVPIATPPAFGAAVKVRMATPSGAIVVDARVVHVIDATMATQLGMSAGVGLQLDAAELERAAQRVEDDGKDVDAEALTILARRLIGLVERGDYYGAIELEPGALQPEVDARLAELTDILTDASIDLPPTRAARMHPARVSLARVRQVLGDPQRRLAYDFEHGTIDAEQRLRVAADRNGPDATTLRSVWRTCHPTEAKRAQELLASAFDARRAKAFEEALRLGREALTLDPFWLELRRTVETWSSLYDPQ